MNDKNPPKTAGFPALLALIERRQLTEDQSAALLGVPVFTLRKWQAGTRAPNAAALRLVEVLCLVEVMAPSILDSLTPEAVMTKRPRTKASTGAN
jgi:hypothetical protein